MKRKSRVLIVALAITSLSSVYAFAATSPMEDLKNRQEMDPALKSRIEELREEGKTRAEIGQILKSEGYEIREGERPVLSEELRTRIEELREEGKTRAEIGEILKSEGYELPIRPEK